MAVMDLRTVSVQVTVQETLQNSQCSLSGIGCGACSPLGQSQRVRRRARIWPINELATFGSFRPGALGCEPSRTSGLLNK